MILPTVRASFGRRDALHLVRLLAGDDTEVAEAARERLEQEGIDTLLDDPRVLNALLTDPQAGAPPALVFYVLVRQALLEGGIQDPHVADYVSSLIVAFGRGRRAYRVTEGSCDEYRYLVDLVVDRESAQSREAFLLNVHLGNLSLWLSGLFPHYVEARVRRRGAPPLRYYENMGSTGYRMAATSGEATRFGLDDILNEVAEHFSGVRVALNRISDRYLWPGSGDQVTRLLRSLEQNGR